MAFERVTCEIYYKVNVYENYSERRIVFDYGFLEFETREDAERFLAEEGYTFDESDGFSWKKPQAYRDAWITRHLREIKE